MIKSWEELRATIKNLFFNSRFITNPDDVYQSLIDIVNGLEENQELYLRSQKHLTEFLFENHKDTVEFWLGYLGGNAVKLIEIKFINSFGETLSNEEVLKMHDNQMKDIKVKDNIFVVFELNEERVKELNG